MPEPPAFTDGWQLGKPDLVLEMPVGFELPASGPDVYRNFVLPTRLAEDRWVRAIEIRPGARRAVHHALFAYASGGSMSKRDGADGRPGFAGNMAVGVLPGPGGSGGLGGWAVGGRAMVFPDGMEARLPGGADFLLQVHFHPTGKTETERSAVGLYFSDGPPTKAAVSIELPALFGFGAGIDIPAGEANYVIRDAFTLPADVRVYSAYAHAHYLGREMRVDAVLPDGSRKPLLWIHNWDFNWQEFYAYKNPVTLPKGTRLEATLTVRQLLWESAQPAQPSRARAVGPRVPGRDGHDWSIAGDPRPSRRGSASAGARRTDEGCHSGGCGGRHGTPVPGPAGGNRREMSGRMRVALQIVLDSVLVAAVVWIVLYAFSDQPPPLGLFATVLIYALVIAAPAHVILGRVFPLAWGGAAVQWTLFVVMLAAIAAAGSVVGTLIVRGANLETGLAFGTHVMVSMRLAVFLALLIGVVQATLQRLRDRLHDTEMKLHAQALENERALKLASEARLAALEARVHPHFLFNALNTVSSLIPEAPEQAERLVERMAAVLRFSLDAHNGRLVPVEQEMRIVRDYLEIERARFGDRLRYTLDVDSGLDALLVPPFAIQTLVENSVKFAVAPDRKGGEVRVRARCEGSHVRLEVADTGPGFSMDDVPAGHGLDNLRGRLALTFGALEPLRLDRRDGWTTVSFQVPE